MQHRPAQFLCVNCGIPCHPEDADWHWEVLTSMSLDRQPGRRASVSVLQSHAQARLYDLLTLVKRPQLWGGWAELAGARPQEGPVGWHAGTAWKGTVARKLPLQTQSHPGRCLGRRKQLLGGESEMGHPGECPTQKNEETNSKQNNCP